MEKITGYYNSPLGIIEIKSIGNTICYLMFINSAKGNKINEHCIDFNLKLSEIIKKCIQQLEEYFIGKRFNFDIATTQYGTTFQKNVWNTLTKISYGNTISYLELSKQINNIKAIRAVGTANGANSISIIIPCHRVIASNGNLTGYSGDLWRKEWLINHEAKFAYGIQTLF